jgi:alpha-beta hydrolase superfamily lysophospholipase
MLRALGRDPLVIKATRVDVLYGVSNLMDRAVQDEIGPVRTLILYGQHDDIIPRGPTCRWLRSLPAEPAPLRQVLVYRDGYHMLTRDLQAQVVLEDIFNWLIGSDEIQKRQDFIKVDIFCQGIVD